MATVISGDTGVSQIQDGAVSSSAKIAPGAVKADDLGGGTGSGNMTTYTAAVTPLPATATPVAQTHGLGVVPVEAVLELTCLTAELGFSVGDVVERPCEFNGTTAYSPITPWKNSTQVGFTLTSGLPLAGLARSTGNAAIFTAANWSYRFRLRAA